MKCGLFQPKYYGMCPVNDYLHLVEDKVSVLKRVTRDCKRVVYYQIVFSEGLVEIDQLAFNLIKL